MGARRLRRHRRPHHAAGRSRLLQPRGTLAGRRLEAPREGRRLSPPRDCAGWTPPRTSSRRGAHVNLRIVALGHRMPAWVSGRLCRIREAPAARIRGRTRRTQAGAARLRASPPRNCLRRKRCAFAPRAPDTRSSRWTSVATPWTTRQLAQQTATLARRGAGRRVRHRQRRRAGRRRQARRRRGVRAVRADAAARPGARHAGRAALPRRQRARRPPLSS